MKKQDKLDCQKVKEMIINHTLSISALSESALNMLIAYETECLMECETEYDMAFMDLCYNALEKFQDNNSVLSDEMIEELGKNAYQEYINMNLINKTPYTPKTKIYPTKKLLRYFIAAAILLVVLTATVAAVWNPFDSWLKERKLIDVKQGEVLENDNGSFTSDTYQSFSSINEMEDTLDLHIEIFDHISATPESIKLTTQGNIKFIIAQYNINKKDVLIEIYLENAPYHRESLEQAKTEKQIIWELDGYMIRRSEIQIIAFDNNYVYNISSDSLDTILQLMKG